jgi:hypothetical protein
MSSSAQEPPLPSAPAPPPPPQAKHQLFPPTLLSNGIEYSVHTVPRAFRSDLAPVLPGVPLEGEPTFLIVPTCQRSCVDLVNWDDPVAREKDLLLERFVAWAAVVCDRLAARGFWGDYVDPCSGLAVRTPHSRIAYPEVDAFEALLKWRTGLAGCCKVLAHPTWGTHAYLATLFARAPMEALQEAIAEATASVPVIPRQEAGAAGGGGATEAAEGGSTGSSVCKG